MANNDPLVMTSPAPGQPDPLAVQKQPENDPLVMGKPSAAVGAGVYPAGYNSSAKADKKVNTLLTKALDVQGYHVRKALTGESDTDKQMAKIRHLIPGMDTFYGPQQGNAPMVHTGIKPLDAISQPIANALNHASQGIIDASISGVLDPLTYESFFLPGASKALKPALMSGMEKTAVTRGISKALSKVSEPVKGYFDWGAPAAQAGFDPAVIRGAGHTAKYEGSRIQQRIMERVDSIANGKPITAADGKVRPAPPALTDTERLNVQKALNGEIDHAPTGNVYHGSPNEGITRILSRPQNRQWDNATSQLGAFVSTTPESASRYGKNIYRADLELKKPYEMPFREFNYLQSPNKAADGSSLAGEKWGSRAEELKGEASRLRQRLESEGHDGVIVRNSKGDPIEIASFHDIPIPRGKLTPREELATRQLRTLTNLDYNLRRSWGKELLQQRHPEMKPEELEEQLDKDYPKRENYMPQSFNAKGQVGREAHVTSPTHHYDPRNLPQQEFLVNSPQDLTKGFEAMASNTGRQKATQVLHNILGDVLDDKRVDKMFEQMVPATGDKRTLKDYLREGLLTAVGYPRAGVVSLTPRHTFNIADLAINTVPPEKMGKFTAQVTDLVGKLMTASPREYAELTKEMPSAVGGAFRERHAFFQKFPDWLAKDPEFFGKFAGKKIPILSQWTGFNNKLVWATDAAMKIAYGRILKEAGGEGAQALGKIPEGMTEEEATRLRSGGLASERLVDYEHLSPFQKQLRYIAPFGTFRGGIGPAAIGGIARNPARAAFLSRATAGAFTGDRPETGDRPGLQMSNPTADVGRLLDWNRQVSSRGRTYPISGPAEFAQATLGNLPSAAVGLGADVMFPSKLPISQNPMAYGQTWLPKRDKKTGQLDLGFVADQALAGIPEAQAFLQAMGLSRFKWKGLAHELIRQGTGVQYSPPKPPPVQGDPLLMSAPRP